MLSLSPDVLVLGAGPAGCMTASLLREQGLEVAVLERSRFPRFALGESLLPRCMDHLLNAGLLSRLAACDFVEKPGVVFLRGDDQVAFDFADQHTLGWPWTWQVERSRFDTALANTLTARGVPVWFGHEVTEFVPGTHPVAVVRTPNGRTRRVLPRMVVDATGHSRLLSHLLGLELPTGQPERRAIFAHVGWSRAGQQDPDTRTVFAMHPGGGWVWLIPLSNTTASIGVVGTPAFFRTLPTDDAACLHHVMAGVPGIFRRLRLDRFLYGPGSFEDYSGAVGQLHGPGYVLVGSALGFTDPMFSTGVTVALESAALAAPLVANALRGESVDWDEQYGAPLMQGINVVRTFVNGWYDGTLPEVFFGKNWHPSFRRQLTSVLSGHLWDETNPFVRRADRSVPGLPDP